jgi:hypothetical protein
VIKVAEEKVESPSLSTLSDGAGPAFELKFLLDEARAQEAEAWARRHLALDPHGDAALGGAYRTTTLYSDTQELDVYYRTPPYNRSKFRVRRYGSEPWLYLERKSKSGDRVAKRRTSLAEEELPELARPMSLVDWPGHWFHRRLLSRRLCPVCQVVYLRTAYVDGCTANTYMAGPLRLTLDRRIHGVLTSDWRLDAVEGGLPLLTGQVVLELKFRNALPIPFKELVADLRLRPMTVSKYRLCREAWGVTSLFREAADA